MSRAPRSPGRQAPAVDIERRSDGTMLLRCPYPTREPARSIPAVLRDKAVLHPDRPLLGERVGGRWQTLSYGEAWAGVIRAGKTLAGLGLSQDNTVAILCPKSFTHFQLAFGAQVAGVPVAPVSVPYSLMSKGHEKLRHIVGLLQPSIMLVDDRRDYARALSSLDADGLLENVTVLDSATFAGWLAPTPSDAWVAAALEGLGHDTVARYMFTSGSTGMPKGVIYTQGMMVSNIAMYEGLNLASSTRERQGPRVLDWMPWSHTSAGVTRLNGQIANGGSVYFDTGRPVSGEFDETLRNMREVKPTRLAGAPVGHAMLADALEQDDDLNTLVFENVNGLGFGSASMTPALFDRLQALKLKATGTRLNMGCSLGSTEVLGATAVYWPIDHPDNIGLPIPGMTIKLVPNGGKLELRVKGANVTPGYLRDPEKTRSSFDEEGYFKMGDAVRFVDPEIPEKGLAFDGRVAEQFKLDTGTWVSAGTLRSQVVAAASPYLRDAVICGLNESFIAILAWPNIEACSTLLNLGPSMSLDERAQTIVSSPRVNDEVANALVRHNREHPSSSTRIERFLLMSEPPSVEGHELTEKGYINQRATLERRAHLVDLLYERDLARQADDSGPVTHVR